MRRLWRFWPSSSSCCGSGCCCRVPLCAVWSCVVPSKCPCTATRNNRDGDVNLTSNRCRHVTLTDAHQCSWACSLDQRAPVPFVQLFVARHFKHSCTTVMQRDDHGFSTFRNRKTSDLTFNVNCYGRGSCQTEIRASRTFPGTNF